MRPMSRNRKASVKSIVVLKSCLHDKDHIITDPAIVITENIEEAELLPLPTDEVAGATDSDTLQSDIDTIITLLNKIRLNNTSITVRQLLLTVVVTDINFASGFESLKISLHGGLIRMS